LRDTVTNSDENKDRIPSGKMPTAAQKTLFRQQVIEHITIRQYGTVILTRPVSHIILTFIFTALAFLLITFFGFFETTRKAPVQGMLVPTAGVIRAFPNQAGSIKESRSRKASTFAKVKLCLSSPASVVRRNQAQRKA